VGRNWSRRSASERKERVGCLNFPSKRNPFQLQTSYFFGRRAGKRKFTRPYSVFVRSHASHPASNSISFLIHLFAPSTIQDSGKMSSSSSSSASLSHPFTPVVLSVAALLFLASGWNTLSARRSQRIISSTKTTTVPIPITSKSTSSSTVQATYLVTPEMCAFPSPSLASSATQALPFVRSGPLLKLIDICAGISARRHSSHLCLTISLDAVLILKPIYLGELIHLSGSVNRAWNSSLEVGVRVMKENESGQKEYVCHAYLTFVAVNKDPKGTGNGNEKEKVKLSTINPISRIEKRRHLTAGLRRNKRIADAKKGETRDGVSKEIKEMVKKEVLKLGESRDCGKEDHGIAADEVDKEKGRVENDEIDRFELEVSTSCARGLQLAKRRQS